MSDDASKELTGTPSPAPQGDGSGASEAARKLAQDTASQILKRFGDQLPRHERLRAVATFRRVLIPAKRPGRRPSENITAAHRDWTAGIHGLDLYRKHIPGWAKHNHWRRKAESQSLMDAIHKRARREQKARANSSPDGVDDTSPR